MSSYDTLSTKNGDALHLALALGPKETAFALACIYHEILEEFEVPPKLAYIVVKTMFLSYHRMMEFKE